MVRFGKCQDVIPDRVIARVPDYAEFLLAGFGVFSQGSVREAVWTFDEYDSGDVRRPESEMGDYNRDDVSRLNIDVTRKCMDPAQVEHHPGS